MSNLPRLRLLADELRLPITPGTLGKRRAWANGYVALRGAPPRPPDRMAFGPFERVRTHFETQPAEIVGYARNANGDHLLVLRTELRYVAISARHYVAIQNAAPHRTLTLSVPLSLAHPVEVYADATLVGLAMPLIEKYAPRAEMERLFPQGLPVDLRRWPYPEWRQIHVPHRG